MVILQAAIGFISDAIAKAKADAQAGLDLMAKGNTIYASENEKKMASFIKAKQAREQEIAEVKGGKRAMTEEFLKTPEGEALLARRKAAEDELYGGRGGRRTRMSGVGAKAYNDPNDEGLQAAALKAFLASPEGKAYQPIFDSKKDQNFKGPEGFGNVIGVGANPVMEAMAEQTELARQQLVELQKLNANSGNAGVPTDFTKNTK